MISRGSSVVADGPAPHASALSRAQLFERIQFHNPTATVDFLGRFADPDLKTYLDHLLIASGPRLERKQWLRPGDSPAIMAFAPEADA